MHAHATGIDDGISSNIFVSGLPGKLVEHNVLAALRLTKLILVSIPSRNDDDGAEKF